MSLNSDLISKVVGYSLETFQPDITPNLPMRIAVLGQGNTSKQGSYTENEPFSFITAKAIGEKYGYGSPLYHVARILRPPQGGGVGSIETIAYPQNDASGAATNEQTITPSGPATGNATHTIRICDREGIDGQRYDVPISDGDDAAAIGTSIKDTINSVLAAPVTATVDGTTGVVTVTAKFAGLIGQEIDIQVKTNDKPVGVSYAIAETTAGSGTPELTNALDNFENEWNTIVINPYAEEVLSTLEADNGSPNDGTGRYDPKVFKPYVALFGDRSSDANIDFSTRKEELTNVVVPIPNASYLTAEAAASAGRLLALQAHNEPHLDVSGKTLPQISAASSAGRFGDYTFRDQQVKAGWSTVIITNGQYQIQDFVTTYHPDGEIPLQFNFVRNLIIDWNIRFRYYLLEQENVVDHVIAGDDAAVTARKVVKPKTWKQKLRTLADDLEADGLITDKEFMKNSLQVSISDTNPDRLDTRFKYKRTGFGRIGSTVASAGFNVG